jgi:transcriptional regulator with XRE-family HTH domain
MEHAMKISPSTVRRLRTERGWSQEQLAIAAGLSLRTVQRVEADGTASLGTAAGLAATFGVRILQLQDEPRPPVEAQRPGGQATLFLGLAVIMLAVIGESGRLPGNPQSQGFAALNLLAAVVGLLLVVPAAVRRMRARQYAGVALAIIGTPLVTLLVGGVVVALLGGRPPLWPLLGMGAGGAVLVVMAVREFGRRENGATLAPDAW